MAAKAKSPAAKATPSKTKSAAGRQAQRPGPAALKAPGKSKAPAPRMSLVEAMAALKAAGSETTRRTWLRHGAKEPLFGVSFATLKTLLKRIGVDHELALALWDTGNADARNLAVKIADPARMTVADLDRWAQEGAGRFCGGYVAALAGEGPHGLARAQAWLASSDAAHRQSGWSLVGWLAMRDPTLPDAWYLARLAEIEKTLSAAPSAQREAMNHALIAIGCRNAALRKAALAAAKRLGPVEVDHGDTACKTPDAVGTIEKTWAYAASKKFESPAAQERARESMRLRC